MKITILLNPSAGKGKTQRALDEAVEVLRRSGAETEILESRDSDHLTALAREACAAGPDMVVAAGGDGTVHYILNGMIGSETPLGFLPLGRGNDLARELGIPSEARAAAEILLKGQVREIDLGRVSTATRTETESERRSAYYACIAGVGFDSVVNRFANDLARRARGRLAYFRGILRCLSSYRPQPLEIISDERKFSSEVMFAVVGNSTSYGNGIRITPLAQLDDGLLDVCIVPAMSKWELLRWLRRAYRGAHLAHPRIIYFQARRVTLRSPTPLELFGDGEFLRSMPATINLEPRALRVVVPE